jgi:hypothetical protein
VVAAAVPNGTGKRRGNVGVSSSELWLRFPDLPGDMMIFGWHLPLSRYSTHSFTYTVWSREIGSTAARDQ